MACQHSLHNQTQATNSPTIDLVTIFSAGWSPNPNPSRCSDTALTPGWWFPVNDSINPAYTRGSKFNCSNHWYPGDFFISTLRPFAMEHETGSTQSRIWSEEDRLTCKLQRKQFKLMTTYTEGIRDVKLNSSHPTDLRELWSFAETDLLYQNDRPSNLVKTSEIADNIAVLNYFAIIDSFVTAIAGQFSSTRGFASYGDWHSCMGSQSNTSNCYLTYGNLTLQFDPRVVLPG